MTEHAHRCAGVRARLINFVANVQRGERHVRRGNHFGRGQHVRLQRIRLRAKHTSSATKAGDHFIGDKQNLVFFQDRLNLFKVCWRRHDHAACTLHRLGDKTTNGVRPFAQNQRFQFFRQSRRKLLRRFAIFRELIRMRTADAKHTVNRQIEVLMHGRNARQRRRGERHAVIALDPRDDLFLERFTDGVMVVAHQFERGVVRLRAGVCEDHSTVAQRLRRRE